jgi:hypothetical protein
MSSNQDPEARSRQAMAELERAIAHGEAQLREGDELFAKLDLPRGAVARFLASDKLTPQERANAEKELSAFREEVARDMEAGVRSAKESKPRTKVKPGAMRV